MIEGISQPRGIHLQIVEVMKHFPEGVSANRIRHELQGAGVPREELGNLVSRIKELDQWFIIERRIVRQAPTRKRLHTSDEPQLTESLRAAVLYAARGHCGRCGKSIMRDGITLVVKSNRPGHCVDIGLRNSLWAVCEDCDNKRQGAFRPSDHRRRATQAELLPNIENSGKASSVGVEFSPGRIPSEAAISSDSRSGETLKHSTAL